MEGTYGHYIWRAAARGDRAFLCGRRRRGYGSGIEEEQQPGSIESAMLASADGLVWSFHSLFAGDFGDETAFLFEEDGSAVALVRDGDKKRARVCRSAPPWKAWTSAYLQRNVGGPLLTRWGGHYLVGGRKSMGDTAATCLWWLHGDASARSGGAAERRRQLLSRVRGPGRGPGAAVLLLESRRKHRRLPRRADAGLVPGAGKRRNSRGVARAVTGGRPGSSGMPRQV